MGKPTLLLIGTHHKTGSVWMRELFQAIARELGLPFERLPAHQWPEDMDRPAAPSPRILFQDHSFFALVPESVVAAGIHVVRDPRDVLISAANYHGYAQERWLLRKRSDFGDRSYQEVIRALDFPDAVRFEMRHSAGRAIRDMVGFDAQEVFLTVAYEDLISERRLEHASALFSHLGFDGEHLARCIEIFLDPAISKITAQGAVQADSDHIQSGEAGQWRYLYDEALLAAFRERFGDAPERLGYPPSDPDLLIDDPARRERYLADFRGKRGF
ncbi:MAG: sulfotransferase domain-containing protein [Geminicoccaceae bacterium]